LNQPHVHIRSLIRRMALIISVLASLVILAIALTKPSLIYEVLQLRVDSVQAAVMFQSGVYLILYGSLAVISYFKVSWISFALLAAFIGELFASTQLSGRVSVFASEELKAMQMCVNNLPNGFPQPPLSDILISNSDRTLQVNSIYRNTNTLYKRIGWDGYTPFQYSGFIDFEKSELYSKSLEQPFLYLSTLKAPNPADNGYYSFPESDLTRTITITNFLPQEIEMEANLDAPKLLVLNQNTHPAWRVALNQREARIELVDGNLTGVILPEGFNKVKFWFEPGPLWNGLLISGVLFVILLGLWTYLQIGLLPSSVIFTLILAKLLFTISQSDRAFEVDNTAGMGAHLVNTIDQVSANDMLTDRFLDDYDLPRFREWIFNAPDTITYWSRDLCLTTEQKLASILNQYYIIRDTLVQKRYEGLVCIRHSRAEWAVESANYFELTPTNWDKHDEFIEIEPNGNHCQNMDGRPFSSTFHYQLSELEGLLSYIDFTFSVKPKSDAHGGKIVFSIRDGQNTEIYRKDYTFGGMNSMNPAEWSTVQYVSEIPIDLVRAEHVQVYVWNPERSEFLIDNLEVKLQVDVRTFEE
ncbi:MAG: hypothetical protein OEM26_18665, partial [Saprospiraceae bacterium]|nr:hypothetical protein [Saprospiraceae bacterium]